MTSKPDMTDTNKEREAFEAFWKIERKRTWMESGCHKDRGAEPSINWAEGAKHDAWRGWQARASLAASAGSEPVARVIVDAKGVSMMPPQDLNSDVYLDVELFDSAYPHRAPHRVALLAEVAGNTHPSPPEGAGWRPIAEAPEGQMVVVGWLDPEDTEHPERHDFDLLEDGCWQRWHDHAEHVQVIGGHGVSYTPPYTVWMPVGPIPAPPASEAKGA